MRKKRMKERFDLHYEEIAVKKWIDETDVRVTYDDSLIGVPIDYYFPDYKIVLILPKPFHNNYHGRKIQRAVNDRLRKKKVKLIRILDMTMDEYEDCVCIRKADDSKEAFDAAFAEAVEAIMK